MQLVDRALAHEGLLGRGLDVIHVAPALIATRADIDELALRLDRAVASIARSIGAR